MRPDAFLAALAALCLRCAHAQLPNARVGLPANGHGPALSSQSGYPIRERDVPFGERFQMKLTYYKLDVQPLRYKHDSPLDTACCYPSNAYWTSNVAIHPFWFKEFGLDRWCMKDVCLSVWLPDRSHDLMFKITDVCDPADCPDPLTIKIEPQKGRYLYGKQPHHDPDYKPSGPVHAYFVKCWADAMPQPDLEYTIPGPSYINSRSYMIEDTAAQWAKNQAWNKKNGRPVIPLGSLWRPEATQKWVQGYNAKDYPKGCRKKVLGKYQCDRKKVNAVG